MSALSVFDMDGTLLRSTTAGAEIGGHLDQRDRLDALGRDLLPGSPGS